MQESHGQARMSVFLQPCMMREKHAKKYANTLSALQAELLQDWFDLGKYRTGMLFGEDNQRNAFTEVFPAIGHDGIRPMELIWWENLALAERRNANGMVRRKETLLLGKSEK